MTGPVPGRPLCQLSEIEDGEARGFGVPGAALGQPDQAEIRILVARRGTAAFGYVNRCPHLGTPLDLLPDRFMDFNQEYLKCSTHGALFRVETGDCISGPCHGDRLAPVALTLADGVVSLSDPRAG